MREDIFKSTETDPLSTPVVCGKCRRPIAATRETCIYCGVLVAASPPGRSEPNITLEPVDEFTSGFNVVAVDGYDDIDNERITSLLGIDLPYLETVRDSSGGFPIARVGTEECAQALAAGLADLGVGCILVPDQAIDMKVPNRRLGAVKVENDSVALLELATGEETLFSSNDRFLLVEGIICTSRNDAITKGRGGDARILEQSSTDSDQAVLDIYCAGREAGFRAFPSGFDFSILGEDKGLLVRDNWRRLIETLVKRIPRVRLDSTYLDVRTDISAIWPTESRSERSYRSGMLKGGRRSESVEVRSNLAQFNKFSGLKRYLYEREAD